MKEKNLHAKLLAMTLCILSCLGSLYYRLPGKIMLLIVMFLAFLLVQPMIGKNYIRLNIVQAINYAFMVFFIIRNNPNLRSISIVVVLYMITMQTLVLLVQYQGENWIDYTFKFCKMFYLFYALYTIAEKFSVSLFVLSVVLFPSSMETLYSQYSSGCMPGLTNHYSTNGMLLGVGIVIFGSEMIYRKDIKNIFLFLVMIIALLLTGKRSDIIFTVSGLYVAYFFYMSNKKKTRLMNTIFIVIGVGLALLLVINFVPSLATFVTRFEDTAESGDVTLGRTKMWAIAIQCFKESPVIGIGWGRFMYRNLHEWNAHNIYVQLLAETGIVGFSAYIFFFASMLIKSCKHLIWLRVNGNPNNNNEELYMLFAIAMQVFFLLYGITGNPLYDKEVYVPYYIACALTALYTNRRKQLSNGEEK